MKNAVRTSPRDETAIREMPSRHFGLGAAPAAGDGGSGWQSAISLPMTQIPVIEYVTMTVPLPLSDTAIEATFGSTVQVLNQQGTPQGVASVDSSFAINGLLQANMFCCGIGVHAFGEPLSFTQIGNSILSTATTLPISPDVFTANDLAHGALGPTSGIVPASVEWGFADWNAIWHMTNAYQFQWRFCQRYLLLNELMADVCFYGPYAEGMGMGTSDTMVQQYVSQVNDYYGANAGNYFVPVSHRRVGSVNAGGTGATITTNTGVFHPTRDYDLAPVTFGGIKNQAGSGSQPFRKINKPIFLPSGQPISMSLYSQDQYHYDQFARYISVSENAGSNRTALVNVVPDGGTLTGYQVPGNANAGLEITLDQGGNQFSQQLVNTDRALFKGGVMKIAMLIKGFEVGGQWLGVFQNPNNGQQLSNQVYMPGSAQGVGSLGGTAGR